MSIIKKKFKDGDSFSWDDKDNDYPLRITEFGETVDLTKRRAEALYHFMDRIFGDENKSRR